MSCQTTPKSHATRMATKNEGALIPNVANPMTNLATAPSPRQANAKPMATPSTRANPMAVTASSNVAGKASIKASATGRSPK